MAYFSNFDVPVLSLRVTISHWCKAARYLAQIRALFGTTCHPELTPRTVDYSPVVAHLRNLHLVVDNDKPCLVSFLECARAFCEQEESE